MMLTAALVSLLEFSNGFAILTVVLAFSLMFVFILRLQRDDMDNDSSVVVINSPFMQATPVIAMHNPFAFKLHETCTTSYEGVNCVVSCDVPFVVQSFWGVNVVDTHYTLFKDFQHIRSGMFSNSLFHAKCIANGQRIEFDDCHEKEIKVSPSRPITSSDIGHMPRQYYPLVVILCDNSPTPEESPDSDDEIAMMITVIHIKDDLCTINSNILAQYLKHRSGRVSALKELYVAGEGQRNAPPESPLQGDVDCREESVCIICNENPVSRVLLPCRHTCVCGKCFTNLPNGTCPMCRSNIESFFLIRKEAYPTPLKGGFRGITESITYL